MQRADLNLIAALDRVLGKERAAGDRLERFKRFCRGIERHAPFLLPFAHVLLIQRIAHHQQIGAMVKMQVREHDCVQIHGVHMLHQAREHSAATVDQHACWPVLYKIAAARAAGARIRAVATQHG